MAERFDGQIQQFANKTLKKAEDIFKDATSSLFAEIIEKTPKDTGFLISSWTANVNGEIPHLIDGARPGSGITVPPASTAVNSAKAGDVIAAGFIAEYALYIEFGTDKIVAFLMVRSSVQNWLVHVANAVKKEKK